MSALGLNRTRQDGGNDVNDPQATFTPLSQYWIDRLQLTEMGRPPGATYEAARVHQTCWRSGRDPSVFSCSVARTRADPSHRILSDNLNDRWQVGWRAFFEELA